MRIIAGEKKGTTLSRINGDWIRPTSDKIRGALFSTLFSYFPKIEGFIDCFSGSGAVAIEAVSRGVKDVYLFDKSSKSARIIRENLKKTNYKNKVHFYPYSIQKGLGILHKEGIKAEVFFMDPPYKDINQIKDLLESIKKYEILKFGGIIVIEHDKKDEIHNLISDYKVLKEKAYGNTVLTYLER